MTVLPAVVAPLAAIAGANGEFGFAPELMDTTAALAWRSGLLPRGPARMALAAALVNQWLTPRQGAAFDTLR